jgi:ketosteroid isomerase-like protein
MMLTKEELREAMVRWGRSWDEHDIGGVMDLFHEEVFFEHWTGTRIDGREALREAWTPWFTNHGGFRFTEEDIFIDEEGQKVLYQWQLDWPSNEKGSLGKLERRRGIDVIHFRDGKIIRKLTYIKTLIKIEGKRIRFVAKAD